MDAKLIKKVINRISKPLNILICLSTLANVLAVITIIQLNKTGDNANLQTADSFIFTHNSQKS